MTPRERILTALRRREPDRLPFSFAMTGPVRQEFRRRWGGHDLGSGHRNCLHYCL